jgi:hypothetical protein
MQGLFCEAGYISAPTPDHPEKLMNKTLVQEQFGKTAASYLTSALHAKGASPDLTFRLSEGLFIAAKA